jgi:hypothetical protein
MCATYDGRVTRLSASLEIIESWDVELIPSSIEFVNEEVVAIWSGDRVGAFTRTGRPTRPMVEVPSTLLDAEHANPWAIVSNARDESFAIRVDSEAEPVRIPGFVAGTTAGAIWMAGWKERGVSGGFTRWKVADEAFVSPSFVELSFEEWRSQVSSIYEWQPGSYVLPMEGGVLVLGERDDGQLTITKAIKPGKVLGNAIRGKDDECVVLFEDGTLETIHVGD